MSLVDATTGEIVSDRSLEECEEVIARYERTFYEAGQALAEINHGRLYREHYDSFEDYCRERWGYERAHAYRLMNSAKIVEVSPIGDIPNESQARELMPLKDDPDAVGVALANATVAAASRGAKRTAADVREAVAAILADEQTEADREGVFETPEPPAPEAPENRTSEPSVAPKLCADCGAELDSYVGPGPQHGWFCPECEEPPTEPLTGPRGVVPPSGEVSTSDVAQFAPVDWSKERAVKRSPQGEDFAAWMDRRSIKGRVVSEVAAKYAAMCPPELAEAAAAHARAQASAWNHFAEVVTNKPTLGVVK